jgi:glycosyltransferase involved in cell wall biosynthesis
VKRVAIVANVDLKRTVGGVEHHLRRMMKALETRGIEFEIFGYHEGPATNHFGGDLFSGAIGRLSTNMRASSVCSAVREFQPDLIWQHDLFANWLAVRRLSKTIPVVLTNHSGETLEMQDRRLLSGLVRPLLSHYDEIIGPSSELAAVGGRAGVFIPNGVDLDMFDATNLRGPRGQQRSDLYGDDRPTILCARRFAPTKGVLDLAFALKELESGSLATGIRVVFAGGVSTDYPRYYQDVTSVLSGLDSEVLLLGAVSHEELARHYSACSFAVFPSRREAVSLGWLEASASGAPSICTSVGGFLDVVEDQINGVLVESASPSGLASAMRELIEDASHAEEIGGRARSQVRREFGWENIETRTIDLLRTVHLSGRMGS